MIRVIIGYNGPTKNRAMSHKGLGCTSMNIQKTLAGHGVHSEIWPIAGGDDLLAQLKADQLSGNDPITHVTIQAPWIPADWVRRVCMEWPKIQFSVVCHSNIGFLQAESNAIKLTRAYADLALEQHNFSCAGNSHSFVKAVRYAWNRQALLLPNLYYLGDTNLNIKPLWNGGTLKIGLFGATRVQKNFFTAVVAALALGNDLKANLQIHMSGGRNDSAAIRDVVLEAAKAATINLPGVKLVLVPWINNWPEFRNMVASMHLLMQPSTTESFNNVAADGIAESVPSVVARGVINWVPDYWKANHDDFSDIARVGRALLRDQYAARDGWEALEDYNAKSWPAWQDWLNT